MLVFILIFVPSDGPVKWEKSLQKIKEEEEKRNLRLNISVLKILATDTFSSAGYILFTRSWSLSPEYLHFGSLWQWHKIHKSDKPIGWNAMCSAFSVYDSPSIYLTYQMVFRQETHSGSWLLMCYCFCSAKYRVFVCIVVMSGWVLLWCNPCTLSCSSGHAH